MDDLDDLIKDPNGGAYERAEHRVGPPLSYVAQKARGSLEQLHALHATIERLARSGAPASAASVRELQGRLTGAMYYGVVSYLALNNMLALAQDPNVAERLLARSSEDFSDWLDGIDRGGSVTD